MTVHAPLRRPIIANRPLSSVVEVAFRLIASFTARTTAPLIALPLAYAPLVAFAMIYRARKAALI